MIIHSTQKLAKKLPNVSKEKLEETSPLGSWHVNLYSFDHRNCVLFCHDKTRYTIFIPGLRKKEFNELGRWFKEAFLASLAYMGMDDNQVKRAELVLGTVEFDTSTNRSVLGSLNQMQYMLQGRVVEVENVMLLNPLSVTRWLCNTPVSTKNEKDYWMADDAMMKLISAL